MLKLSRYQVNKKLWSFNFGCLLACSFLWLTGVADLVPVPEALHPYTDFILDYYPGVITALSALSLTLLVIWLMNYAFDICISEHTFWLLIPSVTLVVLTALSAFNSLFHVMSAAMPSILVLCAVAVFSRLSQQKLIFNKKCAD
ncbi:hypothetical protein tinsulaeT_26460 [Thalassotalea insulae]|uniref:Uncharacterized protein n=1 Tax=Thalassotalea insulae TaxID=2056778 RepID=A0ABQ6GXE2_9GAMM|nr:hypothetical protein [Thalassotalea insulae]GLX79306.1 hypothetical protein tinsulaeT_26460 [Thalassotalea insulae]